MITAEKVHGRGQDWVRVQFKPTATLNEAMQKVPEAIYSTERRTWLVPWPRLVEFEDRMGDFLIVWKNEDNFSKGGIDENGYSDQPVMPGYSVTYGTNERGDRIITSSTGFKTAPWGDYQVRGLNCLIDRRFLILADDAGLGKTWQVGNAIEALKLKGEVKHGLVLVKASLLSNWVKEIHQHTHQRAVVVAGTQKARHKTYSDLILKDDWTFMIMSYETFREDTMNIQWLDNMRKLDFCIMDEAHKIKNGQSAIGDRVHAIPFTRRYILTATPLPNNPLEAFNYLKFGKVLREEIDWWIAFKNYFAVWDSSMTNREPTAYKNIRELKALIQDNMLRRLKKDKLKDLPAITPRRIPVTMSLAQRRLYDAILKEILADLKETNLTRVPSALAKLMRLQQVANSPALVGDEKTKSAKIDALDDLLEELIDSGKQKVIVFSRFKEMTYILQKRYAKYNPAIIHGDVDANGRTERSAIQQLRKEPGYASMSEAERQKRIDAIMLSERMKMVNKFQDDDSCQLFIGCAPACREGLTLTAATHVVFFDCEYSPAYVEQAYSRAHRIGQKNAVTVHYLVCEGTIDENVQLILERKETMAQTMIDEGIETVGAMKAKEMIHIMATGKAA